MAKKLELRNRPVSLRLTAFTSLFGCVTLASSLCGCGGDEPPEETGPNVFVSDDNNYSSEASLSLPTVETAIRTNLDICWTDITTDIQCHDLAPQDDIDNVSLVRFPRLSEEEIEEGLASDQLTTSQTSGYIEYRTGNETTCTTLHDFTVFGSEVDHDSEYAESDEDTYLLVFTEGTSPGVGARTMMFLEPTSASTNTTVDAPTGCGLLEFSAELSAEPVSIPADGPWLVDWSAITEDSIGNPVAFQRIDGLLIGFYEGMTVLELEQRIFDIEILADPLWELELTETERADLGLAQDRESGELFQGFDTDAEGVWLMALLCNTCQNPSPIVLSVLEPSPGGE